MLIILAGVVETIFSAITPKNKKTKFEKEREQEDWEAVRFGQDLKREDCRKNGKKRKNRPY